MSSLLKTAVVKSANTYIWPFPHHIASCQHCSCQCTFAKTRHLHTKH